MYCTVNTDNSQNTSAPSQMARVHRIRVTSFAACDMWTMPHKTQVVGIDTQHQFNRNTQLLPSDLSSFHSPADKTALLAPETKAFAGSQGCPCSASTRARCSLN